MRFAVFPLHLSKLRLLPRKRDAKSSQQNHLSKPESDSDEHASCIAPATENASLQILFKCPTTAIVFGNATKSPFFLTFDKVHNPVRLPRETTSERQKVVRACGVFYIFTSKCALRRNGMHFFDISTSKSAPNPSVFYTFDFEMCFAPQRRALF